MYQSMLMRLRDQYLLKEGDGVIETMLWSLEFSPSMGITITETRIQPFGENTHITCDPEL